MNHVLNNFIPHNVATVCTLVLGLGVISLCCSIALVRTMTFSQKLTVCISNILFVVFFKVITSTTCVLG